MSLLLSDADYCQVNARFILFIFVIIQLATVDESHLMYDVAAPARCCLLYYKEKRSYFFSTIINYL